MSHQIGDADYIESYTGFIGSNAMIARHQREAADRLEALTALLAAEKALTKTLQIGIDAWAERGRVAEARASAGGGGGDGEDVIIPASKFADLWLAPNSAILAGGNRVLFNGVVYRPDDEQFAAEMTDEKRTVTARIRELEEERDAARADVSQLQAGLCRRTDELGKEILSAESALADLQMRVKPFVALAEAMSVSDGCDPDHRMVYECNSVGFSVGDLRALLSPTSANLAQVATPAPAPDMSGVVEALRRYGRHEDDCPAARLKPGCSCGLTAALSSLRSADANPNPSPDGGKR